jgi:hypothetical protein
MVVWRAWPQNFEGDFSDFHRVTLRKEPSSAAKLG